MWMLLTESASLVIDFFPGWFIRILKGGDDE
jgi:hypothetical protein